MSYDVQEVSTAGGLPILLYTATRGAEVLRFTNAASAVTIGGNAYAPLPGVMNGNIRSVGAEPAQAEFDLIVPVGDAVGEALALPSFRQWQLTIARVHLSDGALESRVVGLGYLGQARRRGERIEIRCKPETDQLGRESLAYIVSRSCRWRLYGTRCGIDRATVEVDVIASAIDGLTVTIDAEPAVIATDPTHFVAGVCRYGDDQVRIRSVSGTSLVLAARFEVLEEGLEPGDPVTIYLAPGCSRALSVCHGRFNNAERFGGFDTLPRKAATEGSGVV